MPCRHSGRPVRHLAHPATPLVLGAATPPNALPRKERTKGQCELRQSESLWNGLSSSHRHSGCPMPHLTHPATPLILRRKLQGLRRIPKETGYTTYSAGGRGASDTGSGTPARGGAAQTPQMRVTMALGRYSAQSHRPRRCGWMRRLTPREEAPAEWGCAEAPPTRPVQPWTVPIPNAERRIAETGRVRHGRPRRQSCDCREGRT